MATSCVLKRISRAYKENIKLMGRCSVRDETRNEVRNGMNRRLENESVHTTPATGAARETGDIIDYDLCSRLAVPMIENQRHPCMPHV
jgi:hypothetical protein